MQVTGANIARLVGDGLDDYLSRIREANAGATEDADKFVDRLGALAAKAADLAAHHLDDYIGRIAAANRIAASDGEQLQQALTGQVASIEAALQRAAGIGEGTRASVEHLRAEADALSAVWAQASERAAALGRTLKDEAQLAETTGEAAAGALRSAFADVNQRLAAVENAAVAVATRIESATGVHTAEIAKLAETADAGRDRIRAAGVALADQASKLTLVAFGATKAQQQVGAAVRMLAQQVDEMAASGEGRMTDLAGMLGRTRDEIAASAASAVQQSETISQTFRGDAEKLVEIAQNAGVQAAAVKGVVREHLEELTQLSNQVAQLVQLVRSGLKGQAEQFKAVAAGARADTTAIREELTQQARTLTEAADQVAGLLNQVGDAVDSKAERLITAADHAMQRSSEISGLFDAQARVLTGAVDGAAEKVDELGRRFEARRMALNEAAAAAEAQMAALENVRKDATRDSFLRSAKAMMDELNAIALDMNALFESEVPEDIWRGYNKGDRSIFARRLFKTRDSYLVPAIEQRYEGDPRFRELVTRYVTTFEDLLTKANEIEPEGTLNATFITADVGKLYLVLSRSLGQSSH